MLRFKLRLRIDRIDLNFKLNWKVTKNFLSGPIRRTLTVTLSGQSNLGSMTNKKMKPNLLMVSKGDWIFDSNTNEYKMLYIELWSRQLNSQDRKRLCKSNCMTPRSIWKKKYWRPVRTDGTKYESKKCTFDNMYKRYLEQFRIRRMGFNSNSLFKQRWSVNKIKTRWSSAITIIW